MNKASFQGSRESLYKYFKWRKLRSEAAVRKVEGLIKLKNSRVLDFGCGFGSLISSLLDSRAIVTGCDIDQKSIDIANKILKGRKDYKIFKVGDEKLPFKSDSFDVVFLFDTVEHTKNPTMVISECKRVLKPGGILYVEFTPYYSVAGHHLYDFTKFPIHILPKKLIGKLIFSKKVSGVFSREDYWNTFLSLNKLRIVKFKRLVKDLVKVEEKFIVRYPGFEIDIPFLGMLGPLGELLIMSFEGVYRKPFEKA